MTRMTFTDDGYAPSRDLQTVPAEIVPILLQGLANTTAANLLAEAEQQLLQPGHNRHTCTCADCDLSKRIAAHLRRDQ